jgi:hypothetical protein
MLAEPPAPVHEIEYVVVVVGLTETEPESVMAPLNWDDPLAEHEMAFVEFHDSTEEDP